MKTCGHVTKIVDKVKFPNNQLQPRNWNNENNGEWVIKYLVSGCGLKY